MDFVWNRLKNAKHTLTFHSSLFSFHCERSELKRNLTLFRKTNRIRTRKSFPLEGKLSEPIRRIRFWSMFVRLRLMRGAVAIAVLKYLRRIRTCFKVQLRHPSSDKAARCSLCDELDFTRRPCQLPLQGEALACTRILYPTALKSPFSLFYTPSWVKPISINSFLLRATQLYFQNPW